MPTASGTSRPQRPAATTTRPSTSRGSAQVPPSAPTCWVLSMSARHRATRTTPTSPANWEAAWLQPIIADLTSILRTAILWRLSNWGQGPTCWATTCTTAAPTRRVRRASHSTRRSAHRVRPTTTCRRSPTTFRLLWANSVRLTHSISCCVPSTSSCTTGLRRWHPWRHRFPGRTT